MQSLNQESFRLVQDGRIGHYYILQFRHMQLLQDGKLLYHIPFISDALATIDPCEKTKPVHVHLAWWIIIQRLIDFVEERLNSWRCSSPFMMDDFFS